MADYFPILLLTITVEVGVILMLWPFLPRTSDRLTSAALWSAIVYVNLMTHPIATLSINEFQQCVFFVEAIVVVLEAIGYRLVVTRTWTQAMLLSMIANFVTTVIGVVLF